MLARSLFMLMGLASFAASTPLNVQSREVFDPPVLVPNAETVWQAGTTQTVVWDTSSLPAGITNTGTLVLRITNSSFGSTLALGFPLLAGSQSVQLPDDLETRDDYIVVLFGDSGNTSPEFTITAVASD